MSKSKVKTIMPNSSSNKDLKALHSVLPSLISLLSKKSNGTATYAPVKDGRHLMSKFKTNESSELRRLSPVPTRGSLLLEWVRRRMSFETIQSTFDSAEDEEEVPYDGVKEFKEKRIKSVEQPDSGKSDKKKNEKKPEVKKKEKGTPEVRVSNIARPPGLEDEVIRYIKKKKEEKEAVANSIQEQIESKVVGRKKIEKKRGKKKKSPAKVSSKSKVPAKKKSDLSLKLKEGAKKEERTEKMDEDDEQTFLEREEQREKKEQSLRVEGLHSTLEMMRNTVEHHNKLENERQKDNYWRLYVECGDLPIVNHIPDMTTYLHLWENNIDQTTPEEASKRTRDVLKLLNALNEFIESDQPKPTELVENYTWLKQWSRRQLGEMMEAVTFRILRNIDANLNHLTLKTGDFNYKDDCFILCLWLKFQLPKPLYNPRKPPPSPISLNFELLKMNLDLPLKIHGEGMVIRVLFLAYDHLSDFCKSFHLPPKPEYYTYTLLDVIQKEWKVKGKYKVLGRYRKFYEQEIQKRENNLDEGTNKSITSDTLSELSPLPKFQLPAVDIDSEIPEVPPTKLNPTPEEYAEALEEMSFNEMRKLLMYIPSKNEINLRKYRIIGGIYMMDLFYQPPQPQHLVTMALQVVSFVLPKKLEKVAFCEEYTAISTEEQKTPEELEFALKMQEEGFEKLVHITLTLPTNVMFLEPPIVCMWDENFQLWSTRDVHDVKQNEEKGSVSFRTGRFGIVGLASLRYGNLPYQTWEIKPDEEGNLIFQLTAAIILFEFKIKGSNIIVSQFQNGPNNALQDIISKNFSLNKLAKIFRESGVDIFPDYDAFCYVEGSCEKHWPTEYICYYDMAKLATCYNFAWSRWNATEGNRSIVMQMRVYNPFLQSQQPQNLVQITPLRAAFINCTEVTPIFCNEPVEGSKFCCTLWYLMKSTSTIYVRNKLQEISQETVYTMAHLLMRTRILSFC